MSYNQRKSSALNYLLKLTLCIFASGGFSGAMAAELEFDGAGYVPKEQSLVCLNGFPSSFDGLRTRSLVNEIQDILTQIQNEKSLIKKWSKKEATAKKNGSSSKIAKIKKQRVLHSKNLKSLKQQNKMLGSVCDSPPHNSLGGFNFDPIINDTVPTGSTIDLLSITPTATGKIPLIFTGSGFTQQMTVTAVITSQGDRIVNLPFDLIDSSHIRVLLNTAAVASVTFTFYKHDVGTGQMTGSNPFPINFILGNSVGEQGDHVATLELANPKIVNPALSSYVVRGVLPVPSGLVRQSDIDNGMAALSIVDSNGAVVETQVEGVSKTPGSFIGDPDPYYDAVEVSGLVSGDQNARSQFKVLIDSHNQPVRPTSFNPRTLLSNAPTTVPSSIKALFSSSDNIKLRAFDPFGNEYQAKILDQVEGSAEIKKYGSTITEVKVASVLAPVTTVSGPQGTLPHLMGVIAYFRLNKEQEVLSLDLIVHNAMSGLTTGNPLGHALKELYFTNLEMELAGAFSVNTRFTTPLTESSYQQGGKTFIRLIKPNADGTMHYLGMHSQLIFRTAISALNSLAIAQSATLLNDQSLAFNIPGQSTNTSAELYSFHNDQTAAYSYGMYLPKLTHLNISNVRSSLATDSNYYSNLIAQGRCHSVLHNVNPGNGQAPYQAYDCSYPLLCGDNANDPSRPGRKCGAQPQMGVEYGGMTSGSGIVFTEGFDSWAAGSQEGYRYQELKMQLNSQQRQDHMYNLDGSITSPDDAAQLGSCGTYIPIEYFNGFNFSNGNDPFGFTTAPTFQRDYVISNGLKPVYQSDLDSFAAHDGQHLIRAYGATAAVASLGNSSQAKDELRSIAEIGNFQHLDRPQRCNGTSPVWDNESLQNSRPNIPNIGVANYSGGREGAHMTVVNALAYAVSDSQYRDRNRSRFEFLADDVYTRALTVTGRLQRGHAYSKICDTATCPGFASPYSTGREHDFNAQAIIASINRVFGSADASRAQALRGVFTSMYYGLLTPDLIWKTSWNAPRGAVLLSPNANSTYIFQDWNDPLIPAVAKQASDHYGPDAGEFMMGMGQVYELTGDDVFLTAAELNLGGAQSTLLGKLQARGLYQLQDGNEVNILACAQRGNC